MIKNIIILSFLLIQIKSYAISKKITLRICANDVRKSVNPEAKYETPSMDIFNYAINKLRNKLDISYTLDFMPMDRCIFNANRGEIDAVLDVSYTEDRALALEYPPGSGPDEMKGSCTSNLKMSCSRYMVLTPKNSKFNYNGKKNILPFPIRASLGYSIAKRLEVEFHENVELSKNDVVCIKKMIRDNTGCVIANFGYIPGMAEYQFKSLLPQIKINKIPYEMRSNYVPFSKKSKISKEDKSIFWKELSLVLKDPKIIKKIKEKYLKIQSKD